MESPVIWASCCGLFTWGSWVWFQAKYRLLFHSSLSPSVFRSTVVFTGCYSGSPFITCFGQHSSGQRTISLAAYLIHSVRWYCAANSQIPAAFTANCYILAAPVHVLLCYGALVTDVPCYYFWVQVIGDSMSSLIATSCFTLFWIVCGIRLCKWVLLKPSSITRCLMGLSPCL